jgi:hypothetical protein
VTNESETWGVLVNETGIFATRGGSDWWMQPWANFSTRPNWTTFDAGAMGGWHHIAYGSRDDAEFARGHMIEKGIAPSFLTVRTLASARKTVTRKTGAVA